MTFNIILSGVGGQGILTIANIIDHAALKQNLSIKQSEVHGMSQRGGIVQSHVRISDSEIYSDLIPLGKANMVLSLEPMESLRYIPYLKNGGYLITDSNPFDNIAYYPDNIELIDQIKSYPNHIIIHATVIAKKMGNSKMANMILLGAASTLIPLPKNSLLDSIQHLFQHKSEKTVQLNLEAFHKGILLTKENKESLV